MTQRLLFLLAAAASAGCAQKAPAPDSAAPEAPAIEYRSAFEGYRALTDDKPAPWRDANEAVKAGHGGHK